MLRLFCSLSLIAALSASQAAWAVDSIFRTNGETTRGTITTFTKDVIKVQQGSKEAEVPTNEVLRVNWDKETASFKNARGHEQAGNVTKALELFNEVKADSADLSSGAKSDLEYLMIRAQARGAIRDPSKADEAIAALEAFKAKNGNHFRYYDLHEFLGRVYAAKGDIAKANEAFGVMASAPYGDLKMAAKILSAEALFNSGDVAGAQKAYGEVVAMSANTPEEKNRQNQARIGQAVCMTKQGQGQQAVELCEKVIKESSPEQASVQAEAFLRKGDALVAAGQNQRAVIAYLAVELLFEAQPAFHAEALYKLSQVWPKVGKADRASDARARLENQYPESRWLAQSN